MQIDGALAGKRVDGRENPLAIADANRLEKDAPFVFLTGHVWSGFNLIGSLAFWKALLGDIQGVVQRASRFHVARQRAYTVALNRTLEERWAAGGFYAVCRQRCDCGAWRLLEVAVGPLPA